MEEFRAFVILRMVLLKSGHISSVVTGLKSIVMAPAIFASSLYGTKKKR